MNLMFADDSQDVSSSRTTPPPKLQSAAEEVEVSKPELDTEATAPVSNDALEAPVKLGEAKDTLVSAKPEADMADMADTLPGSLTEVGFEPFSVPVAGSPLADGPVLQTVSFFDMLKGLD